MNRHLSPEDHKRIVTFYYETDGPFQGQLSFSDNDYYLCNNVYAGDSCSNKLGWQYSYHVGSKALMGVGVPIHTIRFLQDTKTITRHEPSGSHLFRKVYRHEDNLIFVGPVKKDIEECRKPAAVVTVLDWEYLKNTGWEYYEDEPTAEDKLRISAKNRKSVS